MSEPICECGHAIGFHQDGGDCIGGNEPGKRICPCVLFQDARIATLRAEVERLREDSRRLDFIGANKVDVVVGQLGESSPEDWGCYFVGTDDPKLQDHMEIRRTPREAIDAAIKAAEGDKDER